MKRCLRSAQGSAVWGLSRVRACRFAGILAAVNVTLAAEALLQNQGDSMTACLRNGRLSWARAVVLAAEAALALLHRACRFAGLLAAAGLVLATEAALALMQICGGCMRR
eukprot:1160053-Pelagomonas_calceolata.AAC.2